MEDGRIVDLYLERNEEAIEETRKKYGRRLFVFSKRITGNTEDAEECENDSYLRCWNSIPPKEPRDYFQAFLYRIIRNLSIDRVRRSKKEGASLSFDELAEELSDAVSDDFTARLADEQCFAGLMNAFLKREEVRARKIFVKRYFYFESVKEIAAELGVTESLVKTTLFRMRNRFREVLEQEE